MTENEAIETLTLSDDEKEKLPMLKEVYKVAVNALEEIQQYWATGLSPSMVEDLKKEEKRAHKIAIEHAMKLEEYEVLGTVEELREAIKKQRAKKPYVETEKATGLHEDFDCYECPNCDSFLGCISDCKDEHYRYDYCPNCGQAIDWS